MSRETSSGQQLLPVREESVSMSTQLPQLCGTLGRGLSAQPRRSSNFGVTRLGAVSSGRTVARPRNKGTQVPLTTSGTLGGQAEEVQDGMAAQGVAVAARRGLWENPCEKARGPWFLEGSHSCHAVLQVGSL